MQYYTLLHVYKYTHLPPSPPPPLSLSLSLSLSPLGYEPVIVVTCLDLIHQETVRQGKNFEVQVHHKRDKILEAFEDLNLTRQNIYFVTNFHEGTRGGPRVWDEGDKGFDKATKVMVDLARDLLTVADRFIKRKYTKSECSIL